MLKKVFVAIGAVACLCACSVPQTRQDSNPPYTSHQFKNEDVDITWTSEKMASGVRIAGTVRNVRTERSYNFLTLSAKLFDESGKPLSKANLTFPNRMVGSEPFAVEIPVGEPERVQEIKFTYSYGTDEDFFRQEFRSVP